ncbi:TPA: putative DNA modification/repair radical SAM protein [bacterium]|nr:putative DNA modification/repair radical SAM protein [bacterium]
MDTLKKVNLLAEGAKYDVCLSSCLGGRKRDPKDPICKWIYPAVLPDGRFIPLLKILMDNACKNRCLYCAQRNGRVFQEVSFTPDELASFFLRLAQEGLVHGLFLSSAHSHDPNFVMEKMVKAVSIVRKSFQGYVHLKILPGVSLDYVEKAVELADRVSLNLEAPNRERLKKIAPEKAFIKELIEPMRKAGALISQRKGRAKSQITQFVVGASDESDYELLKTTTWLYKEVGLYRAYFSSFHPIPQTPMENHKPTPLIREHRLYQAEFLLRNYGFSLSDIVFDEDGNLSERFDPKMNWAISHPERFPVEINDADYYELLRVPGIGPKSAKEIVYSRRKSKFHSKEDLRRTPVVLKRALPWITIDGCKI